MTGFGRGSVDAGERRLRVEIRSVNHRGLDLKIRSGESDAFCDTEIARAVRAAVERGAVTVLIRDESAAAAAGIDEARVRALHGVLERLRQELKIEAPVTLATVGAYLGASHGSTLSGEALWEVLRPAVAVALKELGSDARPGRSGAGGRSRRAAHAPRRADGDAAGAGGDLARQVRPAAAGAAGAHDGRTGSSGSSVSLESTRRGWPRRLR